jgi:hypothetical protein
MSTSVVLIVDICFISKFYRRTISSTLIVLCLRYSMERGKLRGQAEVAVFVPYLHAVPIIKLTRLQPTSHFSLLSILLWLPSRIFPQSQTSSSECSLLEEQMQARRPSYKGCVTPRRVRRSTGVVD